METERKIKVLIVDDYDLVRENLTALLEAFEDFAPCASLKTL